jgi:hypothetical protein
MDVVGSIVLGVQLINEEQRGRIPCVNTTAREVQEFRWGPGQGEGISSCYISSVAMYAHTDSLQDKALLMDEVWWPI